MKAEKLAEFLMKNPDADIVFYVNNDERKKGTECYFYHLEDENKSYINIRTEDV